MALLNFSYAGNSQSPAKITGKTRQFNVSVDEPVALGGTDEYPNPVEYVLAGYAGCLNVVAHIVAKELHIELQDLEVKVSGVLNPDKLVGVDTTDRAGFQQIEVNLIPKSEASDLELLAWVQEVERRCPVGDNLQNSTPVRLSIDRKPSAVLN